MQEPFGSGGKTQARPPRQDTNHPTLRHSAGDNEACGNHKRHVRATLQLISRKTSMCEAVGEKGLPAIHFVIYMEMSFLAHKLGHSRLRH